jgi:hypothetical protein
MLEAFRGCGRGRRAAAASAGRLRDETGTSGLAALVERLKPGGAARRRLGPFDHDEVAEVLDLSAGWFAAAPRGLLAVVGGTSASPGLAPVRSDCSPQGPRQ